MLLVLMTHTNEKKKNTQHLSFDDNWQNFDLLLHCSKSVTGVSLLFLFQGIHNAISKDMFNVIYISVKDMKSYLFALKCTCMTY